MSSERTCSRGRFSFHERLDGTFDLSPIYQLLF